MATLSFTVPDLQSGRIIEGFAAATGYPPKVSNPDFNINGPDGRVLLDNPQSKVDWLVERVIEHILCVVAEYESRAAKQESTDRVLEVQYMATRIKDDPTAMVSMEAKIAEAKLKEAECAWIMEDVQSIPVVKVDADLAVKLEQAKEVIKGIADGSIDVRDVDPEDPVKPAVVVDPTPIDPEPIVKG